MHPSHSPAVTRRDALKGIGAGLALTGLAALAGRTWAAEPETRPPTPTSPSTPLGWDLPPLPYAYAALEPHFDARTMELHHTQHHQAYITNAKKLLAGHPDLLARGPEALVRDLAGVPESLRAGLRNHAGGHVNHSFFWKILAPAGTGADAGRLAAALGDAFGTMAEFKAQFAAAALQQFGSGWAWLSARPGGKLQIHSTANQDSPLSGGLTPVLGLDVWEHAYYLHYQNRRVDYVQAFWQVVNWPQAAANYAAALAG